MTGSNGVSRSFFAKLQGWNKSYVTQLANEGRLVFDDKGNVLVAESLRRIQETSDPSKEGVVARHARKRGAAPSERGDGGDSARVEHSGDEDEPEERKREPSAYHQARTRRELAAAAREELGLARDARELCEAAAVRAAGTAAGTQLRKIAESLSDDLPPKLVGINDPERIRAILVETLEQMLRDVSSALARAATGDGAA